MRFTMSSKLAGESGLTLKSLGFFFSSSFGGGGGVCVGGMLCVFFNGGMRHCSASVSHVQPANRRS